MQLFVRRHPELKLLFLLEEETEADDGAVDEQAAYYGHDHGLDVDDAGMRKDNRQGNAHDNKEASQEPAEVENGSAGALDKVIGVGALAADPVGDGSEDIGGDDKQRVVVVPESAREDDEKEADGEDEGQGDDGSEACGRHGGRRLGGGGGRSGD
jgi:hypothetical protein